MPLSATGNNSGITRAVDDKPNGKSCTIDGQEELEPPVADEDGSTNADLSLKNELQLEAATELVNAISSFVWNLDCLWGSCLDDNYQEDATIRDNSAYGDVDDAGGTNHISNADDCNNKVGTGRAQQHAIQEPHTTWNDQAKSLIREAYGLLTDHQPQSSFINNGHAQKSPPKQQQQQATRTIVRTSILDLLPSLFTSPCRHFLLAFLPHFMPVALLNDRVGTPGDACSVPLWLRGDDDNEDYYSHCQTKNNQTGYESLASSTQLLENVVTQLLEAFQSLIQTDVSTLVPFIATLSTMFEQLPDDGWDSITQLSADKDDAQETDSPPAPDRPDATTSSARNECFQICISSLPSISEYDLPSLLHSLFALLRTPEEGRLAMEALRAEWMSVCGSSPKENEGKEHGTSCTREKSSLAVSGSNNEAAESNGNNLLFFIGNVILQSILSEQTSGSRYLAQGFLDTLWQTQEVEDSSSPLTSLDVILLIALYSHRGYQRSVESVIDSMAHLQTLSFIELLRPIIRSCYLQTWAGGVKWNEIVHCCMIHWRLR